MAISSSDVVREFFGCYLAQDRERAWDMVADDFVFSSPQDDFIDKAIYFDRCFPTVDRLRGQALIDVVEGRRGDVFVRYEYELIAGTRHRNAEVIRVRDGQIAEVQVYFGAELTECQRPKDVR